MRTRTRMSLGARVSPLFSSLLCSPLLSPHSLHSLCALPILLTLSPLLIDFLRLSSLCTPRRPILTDKWLPTPCGLLPQHQPQSQNVCVHSQFPITQLSCVFTPGCRRPIKAPLVHPLWPGRGAEACRMRDSPPALVVRADTSPWSRVGSAPGLQAQRIRKTDKGAFYSGHEGKK